MKFLTEEKKIETKLQKFFTKFKPVFFKKGDVVISPEEKIHHILYIKHGYIQAQSISKNGEELTLYMARPGWYIPIIPLLTNLPNKYHWKAVTPVEIHKVPSEEMIKFLKKNPPILFSLASRLAAGTEGLLMRLESLVFDSAQTRVEAVLLYFAKHYGKKNGHRITIKHRLTHHELAAWAGLNRETVTRKIKRLEKSGFISYKNHEITINSNLLRALQDKSIL